MTDRQTFPAACPACGADLTEILGGAPAYRCGGGYRQAGPRIDAPLVKLPQPWLRTCGEKPSQVWIGEPEGT